ncbi:MAG: InlB B-repeat-containing protein [Candidatus Methanomethylophilaceae archaeon]|nr:InlB B-repeat-containing protein [Candidatus Methanomethylophilaceae archaeon]
MSGWSPAPHPITGDGNVFIAQYAQTVNKYTVNVMSSTPQLIIGLKKLVGTEFVDVPERNFEDYYGSTFRVYAAFTEMYTQSTLSMIKNGVTMTPIEPGVYEFVVEGNTSIGFNGQIKMNSYTVTWIINEDETKVDQVTYGTVPDAESIVPSWPSDVEYHYEFDKWESNVPGVTVTTPVTQNVTYTAQYNPIKNNYTVTLQSSASFELVRVSPSDTVPYGEEYEFKVSLDDMFTQSLQNIRGWKTVNAVKTIIEDEGTIKGDYKHFTFTVEGNTYVTIEGLQPNRYTVTWNYLDENLEEVQTQLQVVHNVKPSPPNILNVVENESIRKTFTGWDATVVPATGPATYTATYSTEDVLYDLIWPTDTDRYTVKLYKIEQGQDPVEITEHSLETTYGTEYRIIVTMTDAYSKSTPTIQINGVGMEEVNEGSATLDFTITTDTTVTVAGSMPINTYTVRWMNGQTQLSIQTLPHNSVTAYPSTAVPVKQPTESKVFVFNGWDSDNPDIQYGDSLTDDVVFSAKYSEQTRQYNITWRNYDGSILQSSMADYESTPVYPGATDPERPEDAKNRYEFSGWAPEIVPVNGEASYTAQYTVIPLKVTITWKNYNGAIIKIDTGISSGTVPQYTGTDPVRAANAQYTYTFSGWSPAPATVYQDTEYTAQYDETVNNYIVRWSNYDGTILQKSEVPYGETPAYTGEVPLKDPDTQYVYAFSGWAEEIVPVTGDVTYFAAFDSDLRSYTVTWMSYDGVTALREDQVKYGSVPEYHGVTPVKVTPAGYKHTWTGWSEEIVPVTGDTTYTASFEDSIFDIHMTVKVADDPIIAHGTVINAGTVVVDSNGLLHVYDNTLLVEGTTYSFIPVPDTSEEEICVFVSWYINDMPLHGDYQLTGEDLTVEARFASISVKAMLSATTYVGSELMGNFKLDDGQPQMYLAIEDIVVGSTITVDGDKIIIDGKTITAVPAVPAQTTSTITFKEWCYMATGEKVMTGDRVTALTAIGAVFEQTPPAEYTVTWKDYDGTILYGPITVTEGTVPEYEGIPVRTSSGDVVYSFNGWSPAVGPVSEDTVYIATYKTHTETVIITVDLGGAQSTTVSEDQGWTYDHLTGLYSKEFPKASQPLDLGTATKEEGLHFKYEFVGWVTPSGESASPSTSYFAHYRAEMTEIPKEFTVTFDAAGGTVQGSATKKLSYGETYGELPTAVLDGYDFAGWFTHMASGEQITSETVFTEAKDLSVYAHWDKIVPPGPDPPGPDPPGPTPPGPTPPKPDPDHHKETEVIVNPDGSVTTRVTEYDKSKDGTVTNKVTETTNYKDGSSKKTVDEKIRYPDGTVVENKSDTTTHTDGSKTSMEITIRTDAEGNSEKVTIEKHTNPSGHYTSIEVTEVNGGKVIVEKEGDKGSESVSPDIIVDIGKETEVSEEVSEVIHEKIEEVVKGKEDPNVIITTDTPTSIPRSVFETVIDGDGSLTYIENGNILFFTAQVLKGIGLPVHESSLSIVEIEVPSEYDLEHAVVYSITLTVDGVEYHELFDGTVKVTVPYELDDRQTVDRISVYYLHDGMKDSIEFEYIEECVVFYLPHLSMYAIDYDYDDPVPGPSGDQSYLIYAAVGAAIVALFIVAIVLIRRRL